MACVDVGVDIRAVNGTSQNVTMPREGPYQPLLLEVSTYYPFHNLD